MTRLQDSNAVFKTWLLSSYLGSAYFVLGPFSQKLSPMVPRWQLPASHRCGDSLSVSYQWERNSKRHSFHFHCLIGPEWVYVPILEKWLRGPWII